MKQYGSDEQILATANEDDFDAFEKALLTSLLGDNPATCNAAPHQPAPSGSSRSEADAKFHYWVSEARRAEALGNQDLAERYWASAQKWLDIRNQHDGLAE